MLCPRAPPTLHDALDREALDIFLRLGGIELLAHHLEGFAAARRWREPDLLHQLGRVGGEIDLLGDGSVIDIALDLSPALHLGEDPDREGLPGEWVEIDAVRIPLHVAEPVRIGAGEDLLEHGLGLIEIVRRRDRRGDLLAVLRFVRERGRIDDRLEQRRIAVRQCGDEFPGCREGATGMAIPELLGEHVNESDPVVDGALVERIGAEITVDVVRSQVRDHFRRRHCADLDVGIGIDAMLGDVIAQQIVVHGVVERHRELEPFPELGVVLVLVLDRERDRLAVDVLDRRHGVRDRVRPGAERDGKRHRREHMGCVVFLVQGLVANDRPAGGLDHLHVQSVLAVEAHGMRHDDGGGAGDRDEPDLEILLFNGAGIGKRLGRCLEREELRQGGQGRRCADCFEECTARGFPRKDSAHHRRGDHAFVPGLLPLDVLALQLPLRFAVMLRLAAMLSTAASRSVQPPRRIEGIIER